MRVLSNDDMEQVLSAAECMAALESAYRELAAGQGANRPRNHTYFPVEDHQHPGFRFRFKSQEGGSASSGVWAMRVTSDLVGVETLPSGVQRRRLLPAAPGGRYVGLITLYSMTEGKPEITARAGRRVPAPGGQARRRTSGPRPGPPASRSAPPPRPGRTSPRCRTRPR
jgi:hypothetical protein